MLLSAKRGAPAPTEEAKILLANTPNLDDGDMADDLTAVLKQYCNGDDLMNRQDFGAVFEKFGVSNVQVVDSLFAIAGADPEANVTVSDVAALMFTLSGKGSTEQRMRHLFHACDLNGNAQIEKAEMAPVLLSMLRIRERLTSTVTKEEAGGFLALMKPHKQDAATPELVALRQKQRLDLLKGRSKEYAELTTMEQVLSAEARLLTERVFMEADVGSTQSPSGEPSPDGFLTEQEFADWLDEKSKTAKAFTKLFNAFQ